MYNRIAPMFLVDDVDGVLGFYKEVFGAKLQYSLPDKPPFEWASLLLEETEMMFWKKDAA
jgi:uncharacterized glyoxalase superfamily protein PhnB